MSVADAHSKLVMSSKPVLVATLPLVITHSHAYLKSSQVRGWPSDHRSPSRILQVTVMTSPPWPSVTPLLAVVGIGSAASCGTYLASLSTVSRECHTSEATLASVTWVR